MQSNLYRWFSREQEGAKLLDTAASSCAGLLRALQPAPSAVVIGL